MNQIDKNYFNDNKNKQANKVEDILLFDELVLVRIKPNKTSLIWEAIFKSLPFVLIWAAFDIFFIIMVLSTGEAGEMAFFLIPFFLIHLAPVWIYIANIVRVVAGHKNIEYVFTDRRIILRSGIIGIDYKTINYADVVGLNCKVGLLEKMFKVGDIHIQAKCQTAILNNIPDPYYYLSKLQQICLDMKADMAYPNDLRPTTNHGYKSNYKIDD